jgi:DNA repair protein RecO (recombination protein O)
MHLEAEAIVCTALPHGEHGAVVRFLTAERGIVAGYVRGGRSRKIRPVLVAGNTVRVRFDRRGEDQLAQAHVELERSRAGLALDALSLALAEWLTGLAAALLPEEHPYPRIYAGMAALLDLAELAEADAVLAALARFELLLLGELGFGLDLKACGATGRADDLFYVSPKTGRAVSREAGAPYAAKLFWLPAFLVEAAPASAADIAEALRMTRHFIERDLLPNGRGRQLLGARDRIDTRAARLATS